MVFEMKLTSPLVGIQQTDAPVTAVESITPFFLSVIDYKPLVTSFYFIITNFHMELNLR